MLRRLTHLHDLPASGDVAHVGAHVLEQDGGFWIVFPQEYGHYLWEVAIDAASRSAAGRSASTLVARRRPREGHLLPEASVAPPRAQGSLRRRHRRRRRARPRDRVLPREEARRQERRRAREELHRRGRLRPQHDDHPLELPHRRGRGLLPQERRAVRIPLAGARLQPHVLPARAPDARPLRPRHDHRRRARRGEPAARHREPRGRRGRGEAALPADQHLDGRHMADRRRALPPAGRDHPPRRGRLGLREGSRPARRGDPPGHRGDRASTSQNGRVTGVRTNRGDIACDTVVSCTAGWSTQIADMAGRAAADLDEHPPGVRHRAGQAVPRRGDRLRRRCTSTSRRPTAASS